MSRRSLSPAKPTTQPKSRKAKSPAILSALQNWILDNRAQGFSEKTIKEREGFLSRFVWWLENEAQEEPTLESLTPLHVRSFLTYAREPNPEGRFGSSRSSAKEKAKPNTVHAYFREIRAFCNFCMAEGLMDENPLSNVKAPKVPKEQVQPFSQEQLQALLNATGAIPR
jgi:site-specific recombinase XerD